jgi:chromosome partitioning protein
MKQAKVISVCNPNGGVGTTTSSINIGAGLNKLGKKVLLIDLNPNTNLSQSLGVINTENNIYGALSGKYEIDPIEVLTGFFVVPAVFDLSAAEIELSRHPRSEYLLKGIIDKAKSSYDYILIDCPSLLRLLTTNALIASDQVIIPIHPDYLPTLGLSNFMDKIQLLKNNYNSNLIVGGVFLTLYNHQKVLNRDISINIQEYFNNYMFTTKIRDNVTLAEAPISNLDIFRYNAKCNGAKDYLDLSNEILIKNSRIASKLEEEKKETRRTLMLETKLYAQIKAIAHHERLLKKDVVGDALREYVSRYKKKNGKLPPIKEE